MASVSGRANERLRQVIRQEASGERLGSMCIGREAFLALCLDANMWPGEKLDKTRAAVVHYHGCKCCSNLWYLIEALETLPQNPFRFRMGVVFAETAPTPGEY